MTDLQKNVFTPQPKPSPLTDHDTRDLALPSHPVINPLELKHTSTKKHALLPWMIAFHICGTSQIVQSQVSKHMIVGRKHVASNNYPKIDLSPFDADLHGVSRRHMEIIVEDNALKIIDCHSVNGTWLNGKRLPSGVAVPLQHGDELELGKLRMRIGYAMLSFGDEMALRFSAHSS